MAKKKLVKKTKNKKPANKKPQVKAVAKKPELKASVAKPAKAVAEPVIADKNRPKWAAWLPLVAVAAILLSAVIYVAGRTDKTASGANSGNTETSLQVVSGRSGGVSSSQASGALQPQATGLQQSQSNTQLTGGTNLQNAPGMR